MGDQAYRTHSRPVPGATVKTTIPDLADVPAKSRQQSGVRRLLYRTHDPISGPVRVSGVGARPAAYSALRGDGSCHRGVDRTITARNLSVGQRAALFVTRSRPPLRSRIGRAGKGHGNETSTISPALALAASLCRTRDRLDSSRVPGPCHGLRRGLSPTHAGRVLCL
jgi:hypothetical protein